MDDYHLTKKGEMWRLEKEGQNRALVKAETKAAALPDAIKYVSSHGGSLKIHKENGRIQEERTYPRSKDPRGSRG